MFVPGSIPGPLRNLVISLCRARARRQWAWSLATFATRGAKPLMPTRGAGSLNREVTGGGILHFHAAAGIRLRRTRTPNTAHRALRLREQRDNRLRTDQQGNIRTKVAARWHDIVRNHELAAVAVSRRIVARTGAQNDRTQ